MQSTIFFYKAVDSFGVEHRGSIDAENRMDGIEKLRRKDLFVKEIEILSDPRFEVQQNTKKEKISLNLNFKSKKVTAKTVMVFTRQMATLLDAGLPVLRSLTMLQEQQPDGTFKDVLGKLRESIQSGESLSTAVSQHPRIFNTNFVKMVKAGELGGVLDVVLNRLAEFGEKANQVRGKVKSAMMYPGIVMIIAITIVSALLVLIVPKFEKIFFDMLNGQPLPFLTQIVVSASDALKDHFLLILLSIGIIYFGTAALMKNPMVQRLVDRGLYWMPMFGDLVRMSAISHFSRTLGTLLSSGVPVLQALMNAKETAGNTVVADAIMMIHTNVKNGESIKQAMLASKVFPRMVVGMVEVGEETGNLSKMLIKIAELYDEEVDTSVSGLTTLMEPIMIVLLAFLIGTIVIALFLPLIGIMSGLQGGT